VTVRICWPSAAAALPASRQAVSFGEVLGAGAEGLADGWANTTGFTWFQLLTPKNAKTAMIDAVAPIHTGKRPELSESSALSFSSDLPVSGIGGVSSRMPRLGPVELATVGA
jgi:hypothetical protein